MIWTCPTCEKRFKVRDGKRAPDRCPACKLATSGPMGELIAGPLPRNVFVPARKRGMTWRDCGAILALTAIVGIIAIAWLAPRPVKPIDVIQVDDAPQREPGDLAKALDNLRQERREAGKWVRVIGFEGTDTETTRHFRAEEGFRIRWNIVGVVSVHVYTADGDNIQSFDDASKEAIHTIDAPAGEFFLKVRKRSGLVRWHITVEQ